MPRFSFLALARNALTGHRDWPEQWRSPEPKATYDVIIVGRNTTVIRSNYLWDESVAIYEHALKLWEGLSQELNYNVMYSPRGVMMLAHTVHDFQVFKRHIHANRLNGIDNEWLTPDEAVQLGREWIEKYAAIPQAAE